MTIKPRSYAKPQWAFTKQMWVGDLVEMFGYSSRMSLLNAIYTKTFPIHTYIMAGRRVADITTITEYFKNQERLGQENIEERKDKLTRPKRKYNKKVKPRDIAPVVVERKAPETETSDSFFGRTVPTR